MEVGRRAAELEQVDTAARWMNVRSPRHASGRGRSRWQAGGRRSPATRKEEAGWAAEDDDRRGRVAEAGGGSARVGRGGRPAMAARG